MNSKKFAVVGGDSRSISLVNLLKKTGYSVNSFGLGTNEFASLEMALNEVDVVVAPIPFTNDGKTVNSPLHKEPISINDFLKIAADKAIIIGGKFDDEIIVQARYYSNRIVDIIKRDDFAMRNAIPTAEGTIQIAMEETKHTLNASNILILGFGRIGKILAHMLLGIGAKVHIAANNNADKAFAKVYRLDAIKYLQISPILPEMDIIINTVPAMVLDLKLLEKVRTDALIIDIASKPGGVDFEKAREFGLKTIWALSLPGKVAPDTSAKIIYDTIFNILNEMEEK